MKRILVPILSTLLLAFFSVPAVAGSPGSGPGGQDGGGTGGGTGGGGLGPPPAGFGAFCAAPSRSDSAVSAADSTTQVAADAGSGGVPAGHTDSCTVTVNFGQVNGGSTVTILVLQPQVFFVACAGGPAAGRASCGYSVPMTVTVGMTIGRLSFVVPVSTQPGTLVGLAAQVCSSGRCSSMTAVGVSGPGAFVGADAAISLTGASISATEGQPFSGVGATFTDPDPNGPPYEYSATVNWGDGSTPGAVGIDRTAVGSGPIPVVLSHTFVEEGIYQVAVTVHDAYAYSNDVTVTDQATVGDAPLSAGGLTLVRPDPFAGPVATFSDANPFGTLSDYSAVIDWGDGTSSAGEVGNTPAGLAPFDVTGSHAYQALGPYTVKVSICDVGGSCVGATTQLLVYGFSDGGNFVAGDGSAASGSSVTFWGSQWASANALSAGSAPDSFKGFSDDPGAPACGGTWSSAPGNSSHPPDTLPTYMAVVVTSSIAGDRPRVSGNTASVVVVRTDPDYAPDPGAAGTGAVVAVVCP